MNLFNSSSLLSLALCSTLILVGCDKSNQGDAVKAESTEVSDSDTATDTANSAEVSSSSSSSSFLAKQMAKQSMQAFMIPAIAGGSLSDTQKACLQSADENLGVAETQSYLNDTFNNEELEAMNEAYSSDIMQKVNQFSEEQMAVMSGQTVENPIAPPTEEEMQEFAAMFENDPRLKRLREMNENSDPTQNEFVNALKPVINGEFGRCDIDMTI